MNVARSIFMRKGYLLTALAVAVLLAGSAGTAWAQTTGFRRLQQPQGFRVPQARCQRAQMRLCSAHRAPLEVTIRRTTKSRNDPYNYVQPTSDRTPETISIINFEYDGDPGLPPGITVKADDSTTPLSY